LFTNPILCDIMSLLIKHSRDSNRRMTVKGGIIRD
jgi:hypothetical protein